MHICDPAVFTIHVVTEKDIYITRQPGKTSARSTGSQERPMPVDEVCIYPNHHTRNVRRDILFILTKRCTPDRVNMSLS